MISYNNNMKNAPVRVRFAASPTGFLHVGGLRTALFDYLFAKKHEGLFFLRIDDTDQARYVEGAVEQIKKALTGYGIEPDNFDDIYFQSKHLARYKEIADKLLADGHAYECFCAPERLEKLRQRQVDQRRAPKYDRLCLNLSADEKNKLRTQARSVIRMKIPAGESVLEDIVYGRIVTKNEFLDDQILLKSDGYPTYHMANIVDDHDMEITHVVRGEEWIPSAPKHLILYQMLGWRVPEFAHLPLITKPDHKKLSKRDQASDALLYLEVFEVEAILNYIALLGWNPKTEQEIFSKQDLARQFDLAKINRANAIFDVKKFNWLNKQWIGKKELANTTFYKNLSTLIKAEWGIGDAIITKQVAQLILSRIEDFWSLENLVKTEFSFFFAEPQYEKGLLCWKKMTDNEIKQSLTTSKELVAGIKSGVTATDLKKTFFDHIGTGDKGSLLWPLRVALSGLRAGPGPFEIIGILGKEKTSDRINKAIDKLS